jgi:hypothetical protein
MCKSTPRHESTTSAQRHLSHLQCPLAKKTFYLKESASSQTQLFTTPKKCIHSTTPEAKPSLCSPQFSLKIRIFAPTHKAKQSLYPLQLPLKIGIFTPANPAKIKKKPISRKKKVIKNDFLLASFRMI